MGMGNQTDERQRILQYWSMLELFSPQPVPKLTKRSTRPSDRQTVEWRFGDPLPWQTLAPPAPSGKKPKSWRHTVYLGVYQLEDTYQHLHQAFGEDRDAYDERRAGRSACAGVVLDQHGVLVPDSAVLSSALWAVARLITGSTTRSPRWTAEFPRAARDFVDKVDEVEGARRDLSSADRQLSQGQESLQALLRTTHAAAGIMGIDDLATSRIVIDSVVRQDRDEDEAFDSDFLNSFFLEDLATVQTATRSGGCPRALAEYLSPTGVGADRRVDVMTADTTVDDGAGVDRLPKGRWPSAPEHTLALRQQFAVNRALQDLGKGAGLMGVNGPPGTGKTTMLRDVLAGNVVERARRLAALSRPEAAFTATTHTWRSGDFPRTIRQLRPELTGFEMVVASANNAAVENVSTEVPAQDAIAKPWRGKAEYFADIASATLGSTRQGGEGSDDIPRAWGLVAARLGNKNNRSAFRSEFWFDKTTWDTRERTQRTEPRMQSRLKDWKDGKAPHRTWAEARTAFHTAEKRVDAIMGQRRAAQERRKGLGSALAHAEELARRAAQRSDDLRLARDAVRDHAGVTEQAEADFAEVSAAWDRHLATKPGWLETLFSLGGAARTWRAKLEPLEERRDTAENSLGQARALAQRLDHQARTLQTDAADASMNRRRAEAKVSELRRQIAADSDAVGPGYPGEGWTGEQRELHAPWLDAELDWARSELFLAALRLHEDFLANAADDMLKGLRAAMDVVAGSAPRDLEPEKVLAAWQTFFLVVPMVSTTFASYARMFAGLGREALGWLFIDEAGQASPQYAAGAIWRTQRVVAVGDPLQLQPVVTMPQKAQRDIATAFGISSEWIPPQASVQTLADRVSPYGTTLGRGDQAVWVSAPLTVHRRCDDPMFRLCNEIAYDGIMVSGVPRTLDNLKHSDLFDTPDGPRITPSSWLDEPARTTGTHLQENQITRLLRELEQLRAEGVEASEVIAISPFRTIADRLAGLTSRHPDLTAGTIHTAQGREADVVFLVLGGDPSAPGAKSWASETVNLVNVAASRAKRRLYVIGDRAAWSKYNYFQQLAACLGESGPVQE
ncbi:AAA domain-containing protein [Brachybacterium sp. GCM10030268]|uniref:AAA domain-containing protein n=1 Tax=Brachybacterium sp. GCM10030268 TaxID=3273382 RepID=UPI00360F2741